MILITSNQSRQLLHVSYIERVRPEEFHRVEEDFRAQLGGMSPGFNLLTDFSQLEFMELDCAAGLGRFMEALGQAEVGMVVRVIPDPSKDIGMNILTAFHYQRRPRIVTCDNMVQATKALGL